MADYEISFSGASDLKKLLEDNKKLDEVKKIVRENGVEMTSQVKKHVPVKTGFLRRSVLMEVSSDGLSVSTSAYAHYAPYQEYGTRYISGKFFFKFAFDSQSRKFISDLERLFN